MTPQEIVSELDRHIVGQNDAKRAVAIALRNRWRRQQVGDALRAEITPKNILMIGPTGVGKTEIARRLARLADDVAIKLGDNFLRRHAHACPLPDGYAGLSPAATRAAADRPRPDRFDIIPAPRSCGFGWCRCTDHRQSPGSA